MERITALIESNTFLFAGKVVLVVGGYDATALMKDSFWVLFRA